MHSLLAMPLVNTTPVQRGAVLVVRATMLTRSAVSCVRSRAAVLRSRSRSSAGALPSTVSWRTKAKSTVVKRKAKGQKVTTGNLLPTTKTVDVFSGAVLVVRTTMRTRTAVSCMRTRTTVLRTRTRTTAGALQSKKLRNIIVSTVHHHGLMDNCGRKDRAAATADLKLESRNIKGCSL